VLIRQRGVDVDRRVGDKKRLGIVGCVNGKDVTDTPGGAQSANVIDYCEHELIGMERAFHQRVVSNVV
jgi:hypothetical protein